MVKGNIKLYKTKIDFGFAILMIGILSFIGLYILKSDNHNYFGVIIYILTFLFIIHISVTTNYFVVNEKELLIKSSFIINIKIDIGTITKIKETKSLISSPALSRDRLEVFYNKYDSVIISPKNKIEFVEHLKSINSLIKFN